MFDTHCHLSDDVFDDNLTSVVNKARDTGIHSFLIPSISLKSAKKSLAITEQFENIYMAVGIHPTEDLEAINKDDLTVKITDYFRESNRVKAIGEIGLDYYHYKSGASVQKELFKAQMKLGIKLRKPLIVHNRMATNDLLKIIQELGPDNISNQLIFHCCPAEEELLNFAMKYSIFVGIDGDVTYDEQKAEFAKKIPLHLLLLETDSPYLTPVPARETKKYPNEPANLIYLAQKIALVKKITVDDVIAQTTRNAYRVFDISPV